ncbi:MAG TPA: sugar phosphate nucleotidyltransferase [Mycobacteriales bacterium]|nr:sugar phosphate nucleotidyltransferase [Mycobacteriales bacterium]
MSPRAVLLVGGKGSRLRPFTATFPKPLMPLDDVPILEVLLRQLAKSGITRVTLALGHLGELVQAYLSHRRALVDLIELDYVWEDEPLGTAGALSLVEGLDEPFLVMNGDVLTDLDFGALLDDHVRSGAALTIAAHDKKVPIDLGVLQVADDDRLTGYVEKPTQHFYVSMGVYAYSPATLAHIGHAERIDFPDLVLRLLAAGQEVRAYRNDALWLDIGRPDDYALAQELFLERRADLT